MANDRLSQLPVEVVEQPDDAKGRTSQLPTEVVYSPTSGKARTSQLAIEVAVKASLIVAPQVSIT